MAKTVKTIGTPETSILDSFLAGKGIKKEDTKEVTSSSWKWEVGIPKYFKVLGVPVTREKRPGEVKTPPWTAPVKDLDTGNHCTLILNTMLMNQFASFPADELIGKCFVSVAYDPIEGKNYKRFDTRTVPDPEPGE